MGAAVECHVKRHGSLDPIAVSMTCFWPAAAARSVTTRYSIVPSAAMGCEIPVAFRDGGAHAVFLLDAPDAGGTVSNWVRSTARRASVAFGHGGATHGDGRGLAWPAFRRSAIRADGSRVVWTRRISLGS
jgi:hypothetical protein